MAEELRAASDGSFFVFSVPQNGRSHLFRVDASGANLRQLTFGDGLDIDSTVSPDKRWIVYSSNTDQGSFGKNALWRISSAGGAPEQLTTADAHAPHFSPNGQFVSYISGVKIVIMSAADNSIVETFETAQTPVLNIGARWTPDGQALTYIVTRKNVGNVWSQPITGGEPQPLTDFTSGSIYNYAFSADGSRLYVARGNQIRDAILIKNFR